jgi:uncharacterized membrane protein YhiD involved in acid resistance
MNHQNLAISVNEDPFDGAFYLAALCMTISLVSFMFYICATQKIQDIESLLNKKNAKIIDLIEKIENLENQYNKMDSDHVDDYNSLVESFQEQHKDNMRLLRLNAKLEDELMESRSLHSEAKAQNEEFVKRISRLESRLSRTTVKYNE